VFSYAAYFTLTHNLYVFESSLLTLSAAYRERTSGCREHLVLVEEDVFRCCVNRMIAPPRTRPAATAEFFRLFSSMKSQCGEPGHRHVSNSQQQSWRVFDFPLPPARDLQPIHKWILVMAFGCGVVVFGIELTGLHLVSLRTGFPQQFS